MAAFDGQIEQLVKSDSLKAFKNNLALVEDALNSLPSDKRRQSTVKLKQAVDTARRLRVFEPTPAMTRAFSTMINNLSTTNIVDDISDQQARQNAGHVNEPIHTMDNLPTIVNKEIAKTGKREPEWHQVKHLPGYLQSAIRKVARDTFSRYTNTPIEDIQMMVSFDQDQFRLNTKEEVTNVVNWIKKHARLIKDTENLEYNVIMPGYTVDVTVYSALGYDFILMRDEYAQYIYACQGKDQTSLPNSNRKRLR